MKFNMVLLSTDLKDNQLNELLVKSTMGNKFPVLSKTEQEIFMYGKGKKEWGLTQLSNEIEDLIEFPQKLNHGYLISKSKVPNNIFKEIREKNAHSLDFPVKFFIYPFAIAGDRTAVPDDAQLDGSLSYNEGYPIDYQKQIGLDPDAKAIDRTQYNQVLYDATNAIQQYQIHGAPYFISSSDNGGSPFPYPIYSIVRFDDGSGIQLFQSLIDNNTTDPSNIANWALVTLDGMPPGSFLDFGGATPPPGRWLVRNGAVLNVSQYRRLFEAIGNIWPGGNGVTTFAIPNSSRRVTVGSGGTGTSVLPNTVGSIGGSETYTQTLANLPNHIHTTDSNYDRSFGSGGNIQVSTNASSIHSGQAVQINPTGGGQPHTIMQPSEVCLKLIKY